MHFIAILGIALALSMDAFAVAVATGIKLGQTTRRQKFRMCFHFGLFQFLMPVIGWFFGLTVRAYIETWDHWVAFMLLVMIGLNMMREAWKKEEKTADSQDPTRGVSLVMLSTATSIDALAVGLSFSLLQVRVWFPALIIGLVCAGVTATGLYLGRSLSRSELIGRRASLLGGLLLIGIGCKILYDHGVLDLLAAHLV